MLIHHELIDIGLNLTHDSFQSDRESVIERALKAGVTRMIITGASIPGSRDALALAKTRPDLFRSTAGIHPHHAAEADGQSVAALEALHQSPEVAAVGECGLDFYRNYSPRPVQEEWFARQLDLAARLQRPAFLHERDAHQRFHAILREYRDRLPAVVVHCFTGDRQALLAYLDLDCHIGITGWICDERRGKELRELVSLIPSHRLMVETDAPYLLPRDLSPKPGHRRNEPAYLPHVTRSLAHFRGQSFEEVASASTENARNFFGLESSDKA